MNKNQDQSSSSSIRQWLGEVAFGVIERIIGPVKKGSLRVVLAIAILAMPSSASSEPIG